MPKDRKLVEDTGQISLTPIPNASSPLVMAGPVRGLAALPDASIFAVSEAGGVAERTPLGSWTTASSFTSKTLFAVAGTKATDVFAVGDGEIWHRDANGWGSKQLVNGTLYGVAKAAGDEYIAVGTSMGKMVAMRYDGSGWRAETLPQQPTGTLWAAWGDPSGVVYAVGDNGTVLRYGPP